MTRFIKTTSTGFLQRSVRRLGVRAVSLWAAAFSFTYGASNYQTPYTFTAFAGAASLGSADGSGQVARFDGPLGCAVDSTGNIYVADEKNQVIRKITPSGVVSTLAGAAGYAGYVDGAAADARFRLPKDVAVDAVGNVYVADAGNHAIRKITPSGVVSTLAGNGTRGSADGQGSAARFFIPTGIALAGDGALYVADSQNNTIRKVTAAGAVTTFAGTAGVYGSGDGTGAAASFFYPLALTVDPAGNVYVVEAGNNVVRKITPGAVVTTLAGRAGGGSYLDGVGTAASFRGPAAIVTTADGTLFVADYTIRKITPAGEVSTFAGTYSLTGTVDGVGAEARFRYPAGLALDPSGNLIVADRDSNVIRKVTPAAAVTAIAGLAVDDSNRSVDAQGLSARFSGPANIAIDGSGNVIVADAYNNTIRRITPTGVVTTVAGIAGKSGLVDQETGKALFSAPFGVAADGAGNIYVASVGDCTIRKIAADGSVSTVAGSAGVPGSADGSAADARFWSPEAVAVDASGTIFVADTGNHTIRKITAAGQVTTLAGLASQTGFQDGSGSAARFREPSSLALDAAGNLYVADWTNNAIRKVTASGQVTTVAGAGSTSDGSADGTAANARFWGPSGVAVDQAGNIFVADTINHTIRKISPQGEISTVAGLAEVSGSAAGTGAAARFARPVGIAVSANGILYVANSDLEANLIAKGQVAGAPVITAQPANLTASTGASMQFSVTVEGDAPMTYQWYFNGNAISGATTSSYSIASTQSSNAGDYTVTASNALGSATSDKATLTVNAPTPPPTTPSTGDGGGGGGAPSVGFYGAILALALLRVGWARRARCLN